MRQGQQNRRGRGRNNNNNNRKNQNPLARSFESTGPDIKIRGTASHVAEKYMSLARDAQSSGDPVLAENYLQHAEHYNRIILAFREQQGQQNADQQQHSNSNRSANGDAQAGEASGSANDDSQDDQGPDAVSGTGPQPDVGSDSSDENNRRPRQARGSRRSSNGNGSSEFRGRDRRQDHRGGRSSSADSGDTSDADSNEGPSLGGDESEQPAFLRRPVRRGRRSSEPSRDNDGGGEAAAITEDQD